MCICIFIPYGYIPRKDCNCWVIGNLLCLTRRKFAKQLHKFALLPALHNLTKLAVVYVFDYGHSVVVGGCVWFCLAFPSG